MLEKKVTKCFVVKNKCIAATNGFKLCSLISVNTHIRSKSDGCPQRPLCVMPGGGGGTPYNGLYGEAPPERGTFFRLQV